MTDAKTYFKVSAVNLAFLFGGVLISPAVVRTLSYVGVVHAQDGKTLSPVAKVENKPTAPEGNFEWVAPSIASNAAAFETLLAHRIASDQLMVNGYDLLKLQNNLLSMLVANRTITPDQARQIADSAKVDKPLRLQQPPPR